MSAIRRAGLLLAGTLGLFTSVCNASRAAEFVGHGEGIGIKLGLTASGFRGLASPQDKNSQVTIGVDPSDPLLGITGGLFWSYAVAPRFSIQTELQFTQGGADGGLYAGTNPLPDGTVRVNYIELAVLPKVHFRERDRQRFSLYAGMTVGRHCYDKVTPDGEVPTEAAQFGLGTGVMWDYDAGWLTTLVDLRYTTSFNDVQPSSFVESSVKNQALTLSVGLTPGSRRARGQRALEHIQLDWILADARPNQRIRVDLSDEGRMEGLFVRYESDTLTLSHLQPVQRHQHWRRGERPDSVSADAVSAVLVDEREAGIAMERVNQLSVRRGAAMKGALIGTLLGVAVGAIAASGSESEGDFIIVGTAIVTFPVVGAVIGGIDRWVAVYP